VYKHDTQRAIKFGLSWTLRQPLEITDPARKQAVALQADSLEFVVAAREHGTGETSRLTVDEFMYTMPPAAFGMKRRADGKYDLIVRGWDMKRRPGRPWPLPDPIKNYGFPDQATNYFRNAGFLDDLALQFEDLLSGVSYVGPLRDYPRRSYTWGGERPSSVGESGDQAIDALLAARRKTER